MPPPTPLLPGRPTRKANSPEAAEDALGWRFHPTQAMERLPDGSVIVRFWATGLLELAWHLFTWGDRVRVVRPDALRQVLADELQRALQAHLS